MKLWESPKRGRWSSVTAMTSYKLSDMVLRFVSILISMACAWTQAVAIPDTPAGHTLQAWLDAFNSGDRAKIQTYLAKYEPAKPLDGTIAFRNQTGGFELLAIDKSERSHIEFRVH